MAISSKDNVVTLEPTSSSTETLQITEIEMPSSNQVSDDFEYARGNMINIIEKGNEALDGILNVAGQSQQPRSYEVAATLIKTLVDAQKDLLELQKKKKDLSSEASQKNITNNLFVGSTAELQKLIKNNEQK